MPNDPTGAAGEAVSAAIHNADTYGGHALAELRSTAGEAMSLAHTLKLALAAAEADFDADKLHGDAFRSLREAATVVTMKFAGVMDALDSYGAAGGKAPWVATRDNMDGSFWNLAQIVSILNERITSDIQREAGKDGVTSWSFRGAEGAEIQALVWVANDFARRVVAEARL